MTTLVIPLVGSYFYPPATLLLEHLPAGIELMLDPEPDNPHDRNAVRVLLDNPSLKLVLVDVTEAELTAFGTSVSELISEPMIMLGHLRRERDLQTTPGNISALALMAGCDDWIATLQFNMNGRPMVKLQASE